ncbi:MULTISPECIES: GNAT family N-acetyltransferase [Mycobacteriaceae]|nr:MULTISPECIES: GNAT family N-acetyltransferase [Mycobacteriaceae]
MNLELVKIPRRQGAQPFGSDHTGYSFTWFRGISDTDKYTNYRVMLDGVEVARLVTDEMVCLEAYGDAVQYQDAALEIQTFEVRKDHRRQGIGRAVVAELRRQFPDRRLVALSQDEQSDQFWGSGMGWERFVNRDAKCRPAYVQVS